MGYYIVDTPVTNDVPAPTKDTDTFDAGAWTQQVGKDIESIKWSARAFELGSLQLGGSMQGQMQALHDDLRTLNHSIEGVGLIGVVLIGAFAIRAVIDWCAWSTTAGKLHAGIEGAGESLTGISAATFSTSERLGSVGATLDDIDTNAYKTRKILRRSELRWEGQDAR